MSEGKTDSPATRLMTEGGDERITLKPETGLNRYHSAPRPSSVLAYASSTANDISPAAYDRVEERLQELGTDPSPAAYAQELERLRGRIRRAYSVPDEVEIIFAPSGTDLEYVALACAPAGAHNILLGADEVGSGCIYSAFGQYFVAGTALGLATKPGEPVAGLETTRMVDVPVRDAHGIAHRSDEIVRGIDAAVAEAARAGRHPLVHVVHGSKTGLILPSLDDLDRLRTRHDPTFVVDACQARITSSAIADYLARDAIVFITGSKFMGGPPFSGFALVPRAIATRAPALPEGLSTIFRRAEWPAAWPGRERLPDGANLGLLLRFEASLFELERFQRLSLAQIERVIAAFRAAVSAMTRRLGVSEVAPCAPGEAHEAETHPVEMRTLATLDLSAIGGVASFEDAQIWHRELIGHGIRLGQPVKCVKLPDGMKGPQSRCPGDSAAPSWGATLRVGLSMPMVVDRAVLSDAALVSAFESDMAAIGDAITACAHYTASAA